MALHQDRAAFGKAIERQLAGAGRTQAWLADQLTGRLGRDRPMAQATVARWVRGENAPDVAVVFELEDVLEVAPGSLSRLLGFLPVVDGGPVSVVAAVEADVGLTVTGRRIVLKVYEELVEEAVDDGPDGS